MCKKNNKSQFVPENTEKGESNIPLPNLSTGLLTPRKGFKKAKQKSIFLRPDRFTDQDMQKLLAFAKERGAPEIFQQVHERLLEKYKTDFTLESNFAREKVAKDSIVIATTFSGYKHLCFPGILVSWSIYSILFLHRENVVSTNERKFDKYFFFHYRLQVFDQLLRKELENQFAKTLFEARKSALKEHYREQTMDVIEKLAKQYVREKLTYLPFDAFCYCALKGAFCSRRDFLVKLKDYGPIEFRSSLVLNIFSACFGDVFTFRHVCRLLNVYIHHYGMEKKIDGFLIDDTFVKSRLMTKHQSRKFRTSLVDFCLNNPLADEEAKEIVRDRKTVLNESKQNNKIKRN